MAELVTASTPDLGAATLAAVERLCFDAFLGRVDEHDREHALGGTHALLWEEDELVGHAAVVDRRLWHAGRELRTGYVEAVAVRADRRRRGYGGLLMEAIEGVIRSRHELGALSATEAGAALYTARGWLRWRGPTSVRAAGGVVATPEEDGDVFVLPCDAALDPDGGLTCDWRLGDVW